MRELVSETNRLVLTARNAWRSDTWAMVVAAARGDVFGLSGTVLGERFRVDEQIAEGGFAVVYAAHQVALDRKIALKVLKTPAGYDQQAQAEFRDRFAVEAKTIARLKHPHIVDVYDFSVSPLPSGELAPWMALEWVEGETLEKWLGRDGQRRELAPGEALDLLRPVLQALAFAHGQGIVHRDIKPGNIMVTDGGQGRTLRVLDFGIAKIMRADEESSGTGRTRTGSVPAFSPGYAAPEQVTFSRTGPWTDVHALGLILTELITGQAPYADLEASVHEQVMAQARPTPRSKGREAGPFEAVIARAVALVPGERWKNAGDFLAALEEAAGRRVPAPPPAGRWRWPVAVAGLVVVAGVVAALVAGLGVRARARREAPPQANAVPAAAPARPVVQEPSPVAPTAAASAPAEEPRAPPHAPHPKRKIAAPRALDRPGHDLSKDLFDDTK